MSKRTQPRLGRGLSSLIGDTLSRPVKVDLAPEPGAQPPSSNDPQTSGESNLRLISIESIVPNPFQPRRDIDQAGLEQLAQSVKLSGLIQPVVVRPSGEAGAWELIAGERRWRAAKMAGLGSIPALVMEIPDQQAAELAIVENVQREDLNPIERAWAFRRLAEEFGLAQGEIAERVGLDRSSVANLMRLTELDRPIQDLIVRGELTAGHGKALLSVSDAGKRIDLATRAVRDQWSVRVLEKAAARTVRGRGVDDVTPSGRALAPAGVASLEKQLSEHLATKVRIRTARKGNKGRIEVEFYDLDHFDGLMHKLGFRLDS